MYENLRKSFRQTFLFDVLIYFRQRQELENWRKQKVTITPHLIKQQAVLEYANRYTISILVETGTFLGFMVNAVKGKFRKIWSIELDEALSERAKKKLSKYKHINIYQGDSGKLLPLILTQINEPCLFWLDAHYSGGITARGELETPIIMELRHIFTHAQTHSLRHVVIIDDARLFVGCNDYPTIQGVQELIANMQLDMTLDVKDDIIRIHPIGTNGISSL